MPATGAAVELLYGGAWTDITADVYLRDRMRISRGRRDQASRVGPGSLSLTLNNKQGRYSARNPLSPLFGQIGRNTPVRVSVTGEDVYLDLDGTTTAGATTPATDALNITGDLDVRAEVTMNWRDPDLAQGIVGRWDDTGHLWVLWSYQSKIRFTWHSADDVPWAVAADVPDGMPARAAIRATLDVANVDGGATMTLYWASSITDTEWTLIGRVFTPVATYALLTGTTPLTAAVTDDTGLVPAVAHLHAVQVYDGIDGTAVADADFTAQTAGASAFTGDAGLDWSVTAGALTNRAVRMVGEISAWPVRWDVSGGDVYVPAQAAGIMRRLGQGASPLDSTLRRRIPSAAHLLAYWPLEDGADSTQAYSPLDGVQPMRASGLTFASDTSLPGASALPVLGDAASLSGAVPAATGDGWHVEMVYKISDLPATEQTFVSVHVGGGVGGVTQVQVRVSTGGIRVQALDADGDVVQTFLDDNADAISAFTGVWNRLKIFTSVDDDTTAITIGWQNVSTAIWYYVFASYPGSPGAVRSVRGSWGSDFAGMSLGHVGVFNAGGTATNAPTVTIYDGCDDGFDGETAADRYVRLTREEGVPARLPYGAAGTAALGPQRPATLATLLEDAADADIGILYEARDALALAYRPRTTLYNQAPALTLDYTAGDVAPPLEPTDDDTATRNDITISRPGGSSASVSLDTGPLSTQAPPDGVGRYTTSETRNVQTDGQLPGVAAWLLHLGTVDEPRYPAVTVNLAAAPHLIGDACAVDAGDIIAITSPSVWLPPGEIRLMVQGVTEVLGVYDWTITYNCVPASPWTVGVLGSTTRTPRAGTSGCTLGADIDSDDTTLSLVTATGSARWIDSATYGSEFPFDLLLGGGERVTCTAITGTGLTQSATVTRAVNGVTRGWDEGATVALADPTYTAL